MKIIDYLGQDITQGRIGVCPPERILQSRLPNVATAITLVGNTAYFVYLGCTTGNLVVKFVEFWVNAAGTGTQTAEVGLFGTPNPPNKTNQGTNGIFKLVATGSVDSVLTAGVKRNTTAFDGGNGFVVPAGVPLWAGIRTAMSVNQPALAGLCMDHSQGLILSVASSGPLTNSGPWTGSIVALGAYLSAAVAPDLRVTLD